MKYKGACHCGNVQIEVDAPTHPEVIECNCSVCIKSGMLHLVVPANKFRLLTDKDAMSCYTFGSHIAQHYFCTTCGLRPNYIPRSNPDGYSVNVRCFEPFPNTLTIKPFDGQNWEKHASGIAHLSQST